VLVAEPAVPVKVSVPVDVAAVAAAKKVTTCAAPADKVRLDGDTDTPAGIPAICTSTLSGSPYAVAERVTELELPITTVRLAGLATSVNCEPAGGGVEEPPPPHADIAAMPRIAQT
jgi:hypothetical protein